MVNAGYDYNKTKLDTGKGMVFGSIFFLVIIWSQLQLLFELALSPVQAIIEHGPFLFSCTV